MSVGPKLTLYSAVDRVGQVVGPVLSFLCTEQWTEWGKVWGVSGS